jgi:tetratricopeptide (TPR) repeat protein/serine phosphatase RsbU (regulator of sigma subunit)
MIFFASWLTTPLSAQPEQSLEAKLAYLSGTKKVDALNKLSLQNRRKAPQKGIQFAQQALQLAQHQRYAAGKAEAYIRLGKIALSPQRHYAEAVVYFQKALNTAKQANLPLIQADASNLSGIAYRRLGKYGLALGAYKHSLQIATSLNNQRLMAKYLGNTGIIYRQISSYNKALKSYLGALKILESLGNKKMIAYTLNNIGNVYHSLKDYQEATKYYQQALDLQQKSVKKQRSIILLLKNLGSASIELKKYDQALEYYQKSLDASTKTKYSPGISSALIGIGNIYQSLEQYEKALEYSKKALKYNKKTDTRGLMISYQRIGDIYNDLNKYDSAIVYSKAALEKAIKLKNQRKSLAIYKLLTKLNLQLNQSAEAQKYFRKYLEVLDKEYEDNKIKEVNKLKIVYETDKKAQQLQLKNKEYVLLLKENEIQQLALSQAEFERLAKEEKLKILVQQKKLQTVELARQRLVSKNEQKKAALLKKQGQIHEMEAKRQKENSQYQRTIRNFSLVGIAFLFIFLALLFVRYRQNQRSNQQLREKNIEIETQRDQINTHRIELETMNDELKYSNEDIQNKKAEIEAQRDLLSDTIDELSATNKELNHSQNKIIDSIRYASRIQSAVLSSSQLLNNIFPDSFILFKPRDIVSGDFYWFAERDHLKIVIAADCTGHGVPGAFMSVLGTTLLNQIVKEENVTKPVNIVRELDIRLQETLHVTEQTKELQPTDNNKERLPDGMDIAILTIDTEKKQVLYAGAKNHLYLVSNGEFKEIKASSSSLGYSYFRKNFTQTAYDYKAGDTFYISSDGYQDQFGGKTKNGKKFMRANFKRLLHKISSLPMALQYQKLDETIEDWKGNHKQTDDILVIGVRPL